MILVQCITGGEHIYIADEDENRDPHSRLDAAGCSHCKDDADHDHAASASACPREHEGPCWHPGPGPGQVLIRPEGCTVCRPLLIEVMRGTVNVSQVA
jgi:hypothetical protein